MFDSLFQTFDDTAEKRASAARIEALRAALRAASIDGFLVPRADPHQNEYVPPGDERLAWLTGFTGSAGIALILLDRALIFVDGRYTVQVRDQVDTSVLTPVNSGETSLTSWVRENVQKGSRIGFDPWLHTLDACERLGRACSDVGAELVPLLPNPLDQIWTDRPAPPCTPVVVHPHELAGVASRDKIARVAASVAKAGADALVLTDPHEIAWLFNIRGGDVAHTPLPLSWAVVPASGRASLLIDGRKLSPEVRDLLAAEADVVDDVSLPSLLAELGTRGAAVMLDPHAAAERIRLDLDAAGAHVIKAASPIARLKAVKNAAEVHGARSAHHRDAVALVRFLAWFDREAPMRRIDEIMAAQALESFRRENGALKDISFPTISASGPNAALPHYRVTRATNRPVETGLFLIDSGAQYADGTTDVTRTIAVGQTTPLMRDRYTRVLKGHIALVTARFPKGTTGAQLDPFARRALWDAGADFDHGTGHGVGSYLSVHEGPQRISKLGHVPLEPGMILSNEPGYYREGAFGIRIENLVLVCAAPVRDDERPMHGFETLTLAPIDTRPVDDTLLTASELAWLDGYHARVLAEIAPELDEETRDWPRNACAPIAPGTRSNQPG